MPQRRRFLLTIFIAVISVFALSACASKKFAPPAKLGGNDLSGFPRVATVTCFANSSKSVSTLHLFGYTNWNVVYSEFGKKTLAVMRSSSSADEKYFLANDDQQWQSLRLEELEYNFRPQLEVIKRCLEYLRP